MNCIDDLKELGLFFLCGLPILGLFWLATHFSQKIKSRFGRIIALIGCWLGLVTAFSALHYAFYKNLADAILIFTGCILLAGILYFLHKTRRCQWLTLAYWLVKLLDWWKAPSEESSQK